MPATGPKPRYDRDLIRALAGEGYTTARIAREVGCAPVTVRKVLSQQPKAWRTGRRLAKIARDIAELGGDVLEDGRVDLADALRIVLRLGQRHRGE
ncbi:MAG: helix-turn-helix domain-containing protein [Proteobacteria bacterium]|nr:helix-turn-helix domain-containing protein [Pseudomonadota bacterium]